jgi:hypothetical protein
MMNTKFAQRIAVLLAMLVAVGACGDREQAATSALSSPEGLLRYVPADTPYVAATAGDVPDDLADKMGPVVDKALGAYHDLLQALAANAAGAPQESDEVGLPAEAESLISGLERLMSVQGLRDAGIDRDSDFALYGVGLLPVLRISLTDGDLMRSVIDQLETDAGQEMTLASLGNEQYRYVGDEDVRLIVGVFGNELVMAVAPTSLADADLSRLLGITLPEENIATAGTLSAAAERHGLSDYMVALIDFERLAAPFIDAPTGINAELLSLMQYDASALNDTCKNEIRSLAGIMPRAVSGYTEMTASRIASKLAVELRQDIAAGLATISGAVPGLGTRQGGLLSFGVSIDPLAAREFYTTQLDKLDAEPYQCELLADLQATAAAGRGVLNQPVPPIVYGINGFLAVIDDMGGFAPANFVPPADINMRFMLAIDNPEGLLAMGTMFSPELAALDLGPDGVPVRLDMAQIAATGNPVHLAMSDSALALAVGDGAEVGLPGMLAAEIAEQSPIMSMDMDSGRYYQMIGNAMAGDDQLDQLPEVKVAVEELNAISMAFLDRVSFDIFLTSQGIEVLSYAALKP